MRRRILETGGRLLLFMLVFAVPAYAALAPQLPLVDNNGQLSCPTCVTESAPTNHGLVVQGSGQEIGVVGPSSSTTQPLFSNGSGNDPQFRDIAITDLPTSIKTGGSNAGAGAKVATVASGGAVTTGKQVQFDANGNLEATSSDIGGGTQIKSAMDISPLTKLTVASATPVFCGLDGSCSTTANGADVQTRLSGTGTFTGLECDSVEGTTNAVTVVLGVGTCNSAPNVTSKSQNVMSASAWTRGTASGSTAYTDGQCVVLKFSAGTDASKATYRCSVKQSAGT